MKNLRHILLGLAVAAVLLLAGAPPLLYRLGLANIEGLPQPVTPPALRPEQIKWLRCEFQADSHPGNAVTDPWTAEFKFMILRAPPSYDDELAWAVAGNYLSTHLKQRQGWRSSLSAAALTIWVADHWARNQLEIRVHGLLQNAQHYRCPLGPAEWWQR
jgi:hypothetical protein